MIYLFLRFLRCFEKWSELGKIRKNGVKWLCQKPQLYTTSVPFCKYIKRLFIKCGSFLCIPLFISCFPVGYREISVKIFFDLTLVPPVEISIFMFLLPSLIPYASQPDGNMTSFTLHFSSLT